MAVLSFEAIIVWPVGLYFQWVHPDWRWMYAVDPRRLPAGISLLVLFAEAVTLLGGYLTGWALIRARKEPAVLGLLGGLALSLLLLLIFGRARLFQQGTFAEFQAGRAIAAGDGKLGWAIGTCSLGVGLAAAVVAFTLREQGRRARVS
jgi:hypothetical protein